MCESEKRGHELEKSCKRRCIDVPEMAESLTPLLLDFMHLQGAIATVPSEAKARLYP